MAEKIDLVGLDVAENIVGDLFSQGPETLARTNVAELLLFEMKLEMLRCLS